MPSETTKSTKHDQKKECSCNCASGKTVYSLIFIALLIAIIGAGFGIYGTIQANRALSYINGDAETSSSEISSDDGVIEQVDDEEDFGLPTNKEAIEYVAIVYNDGKDYIDIFRDEEDGDSIEYYTYTDDEQYVGDTEQVDVSGIFGYIMDKDVQYLGDGDYTGDEAWGIEVSSTDGFSFVGGTDSAPDWFNDLLKELNADQKGYKSNNS